MGDFAYDIAALMDTVGIRKAKPTVMITNPSRTATRVPIRAAIFGTSGARTTKPTVAGIVARPASSGVIPRVAGSWK